MTEEQLINFVAVSESTPGPFAINTATYVGMETGGFFGAVCATFGLVLPSFAVIMAVAGGYERFKKSKAVQGIMSGLRPTVVGLIGAAVISTGKLVFLPKDIDLSKLLSFGFLTSVAIFGISIFLNHKKKHPIMIIGISALLGIVFGALEDIIIGS